MRPVNLIPPEERRGGRAPSRTGGLAYVVIGVLALALVAVVAVVLTDNQIADRESEVKSLNAQLQQATAEANRLKSYADFAAIKDTRSQTVSTLAKSRFDWYRVFRELGLVIPSDVWLTDLRGGVTPAAAQSAGSSSSGGGSGTSSSDVMSQITGPTLTMEGCAAGHDAVARFEGALRDIDGVTRVAITSSKRVVSPGGDGTSVGAPTSSGCVARGFVVQFETVVAFDEVQIDPTTGLAPATAPAAGDAPPTDVPTSGSDGVGSAVKQQEKVRNSASKQSAKAHEAVSTIIPGAVRP